MKNEKKNNGFGDGGAAKATGSMKEGEVGQIEYWRMKLRELQKVSSTRYERPTNGSLGHRRGAAHFAGKAGHEDKGVGDVREGRKKTVRRIGQADCGGWFVGVAAGANEEKGERQATRPADVRDMPWKIERRAYVGERVRAKTGTDW